MINYVFLLFKQLIHKLLSKTISTFHVQVQMEENLYEYNSWRKQFTYGTSSTFTLRIFYTVISRINTFYCITSNSNIIFIAFADFRVTLINTIMGLEHTMRTLYHTNEEKRPVFVDYLNRTNFQFEILLKHWRFNWGN